MTTKTIHGNSQFQKPSSLRWTWESLGGGGGGVHTEIDHIIVSKRFCLTDVAAVPKFYTGSDHRLLRERFSFAEKRKSQRLHEESSEFWNHQKTPVSGNSRADTSAWNCTSSRQPGTHVRARKALQRGVKKDLKERRAEVLAEAAGAGKSIRYADRKFANRKTRMSALRNPNGTAIASRRGMEKIIYDFYSDRFDSHVHLPPHHLREDGHVIPEVLPSEVRHAIMSVRNRTAPGPDRIRSEHLKNLEPVLINTLARFIRRYLNTRSPNSGRPGKPSCCIRREIHMTSGTIAQFAYCTSSISSLQE
ncbi:hypothetical protein RB195_001101 [Necator americanus]|uniref:Reverse transcriptase domain-containing protein n=1 Tax=Necator americanus TaxID=51031 RepID=A0ABR1DCN5_NECAM